MTSYSVSFALGRYRSVHRTLVFKSKWRRGEESITRAVCVARGQRCRTSSRGSKASGMGNHGGLDISTIMFAFIVSGAQIVRNGVFVILTEDSVAGSSCSDRKTVDQLERRPSRYQHERPYFDDF